MGALNGRRKFLNILSNIWLILGIINKTISENNTILIWKNSMVKCFGNECKKKLITNLHSYCKKRIAKDLDNWTSRKRNNS